LASNYYELLEVDRRASLDVIEAAYRRLALRYHPDRNTAPGALQTMQQINEAYAVLRDPVKRQQYDDTFVAASTQAGPRSSDSAQYGHAANSRPRTAEAVVPTKCQSCGCTDPTLRFAGFPYVISIVFVTMRRGWSGLFCRRCRRNQMMQAKFLSLFLGWWGIPFGPIYTLGAIFGPSEGKVPADLNAEYLKHLGAYFIDHGDLSAGHDALAASLRYQYDEGLDNVYRTVFRHAPETYKSPDHGTGSGFLFGLLAIFTVPLFFWLIGLFSLTSQPDGVASATLLPSPTMPVISTQGAASAISAATRTFTQPPTAVARPTDVARSVLIARPTLVARPTSTATPAPSPEGRVTSGVLEVWQGPGRHYPAERTVLRQGQLFEVVGQYAGCDWLKIAVEGGVTGWIAHSANRVQLASDCADLPAASFRPANSMLYQDGGRVGLGELRIQNAGNVDTAIYLTDLLYDPSAVAYVRSGGTYTIEGIPDGTYYVFIRSGLEWTGDRFASADARRRFDDSFEFTTERKSNADHYRIWKISVSPVLGGNASTAPVAEEVFPEIPDTE